MKRRRVRKSVGKAGVGEWKRAGLDDAEGEGRGEKAPVGRL